MYAQHFTLLADTRRHKFLTQADLAAQVGVGQTYISQLERGSRKPGPVLARRLAEVLGIHIHDIRPDWKA